MNINDRLLKWIFTFNLTPLLITSIISIILMSINYDEYIWLVILLNGILLAWFILSFMAYIIIFFVYLLWVEFFGDKCGFVDESSTDMEV